MKKGFIGLLILILCAFVQFAYGATAVSGRPAPGVVAAASCTTSNDTAIIDLTGDSPTGSHTVWAANPAGVRFTIAATYTITEYQVNIGDTNNEGTLTVAIYTDNSNAIGTVVADTGVTKAAADIAAGPGLNTFTLSSPKTGLSAGTYWLVLSAGGTGAPQFPVRFLSKAGGRITEQGSYYDDYSHPFGIWGCAE